MTRRAVLGGTLATIAASRFPSDARARFPKTVPDNLIFFVGNSFTRQHDIPALVCRIAQQSAADLNCHRHTANGAWLDGSLGFAKSLSRERGSALPGPVVLQDHSIAPLTPEGRDRSAKAMAVYRAQFAKAVLFESWPRRAGHHHYARWGAPSNPDEMAQITHRHYLDQARRLEAVVAPIAPAWLLGAEQRIDLYARDGYHANLAGAWLAALLIAKALDVSNPFAAMPPGDVPAETGRKLSQIAARAWKTHAV